jgi:hypothetical protein
MTHNNYDSFDPLAKKVDQESFRRGGINTYIRGRGMIISGMSGYVVEFKLDGEGGYSAEARPRDGGSLPEENWWDELEPRTGETESRATAALD